MSLIWIWIKWRGWETHLLLRSNGTDFSNTTLVDSPHLSLTDLIDSEQNGVQDRIMQVDGNDDDILSDCEVMVQLDGSLGDEDVTETEEDLSNISTSSSTSGREDVMCPICHEPTKLHKTYHLATKHFKNRLMLILPEEKPFNCPECSHESKTKINMWTHYLESTGTGKSGQKSFKLPDRVGIPE